MNLVTSSIFFFLTTPIISISFYSNKLNSRMVMGLCKKFLRIKDDISYDVPGECVRRYCHFARSHYSKTNFKPYISLANIFQNIFQREPYCPPAYSITAREAILAHGIMRPAMRVTQEPLWQYGTEGIKVGPALDPIMPRCVSLSDG